MRWTEHKTFDEHLEARHDSTVPKLRHSLLAEPSVKGRYSHPASVSQLSDAVLTPMIMTVMAYDDIPVEDHSQT